MHTYLDQPLYMHFTLQPQLPKCTILDSRTSVTAPKVCFNSSHTARVQKFTSIVTETQSSDIQFFPEIIRYRSNQQSSSQSYKAPPSYPTGGPTREQLPLPHTDTAQQTQLTCNKNKCVHTSLDCKGLSSGTSHPEEFLKEYYFNPSGNKEQSEIRICPSQLQHTTLEELSAVGPKAFCSEVVGGDITSLPPREFNIESVKLREDSKHSCVLEITNSLDTATFHRSIGISEESSIEGTSSFNLSITREGSLSGGISDPSSVLVSCEEGFRNPDSQSSINNLTFRGESVMEECSSVPSQVHEDSSYISVESNGFTSASRIDEIDDLEECSNKSRPVPHHSLTVSLSDPESSLAHQV